MKVVFHCSNTANAAAEAVIYALRDNNTPGSRHIFIVPDRFSLSFEREIFERLSLPGAANIDVVSFMRLAIRTLKGRAKGALSKQGAVLIFKRAIDKNIDKLTRYSRAARSMSFAEEMFAVIASVRNGGYTPEDLEAAADTLPKSTQSKAHDIALLYRAYLEELKGGYEDATSRLEKLADAIDESGWIKESKVYIAGFHTFTAKEYAVIGKLIRNAISVDISVTPGNGRANSDRYPSRTFERLKFLAAEAGAEVKVKVNNIKIPEPFYTLNGELFTYSPHKVLSGADRVRLYRETSVYEEANGVAREILRLVRLGLRFKDIAIVNSNPAYQDIFSSIFTRYQIPYFIDRKYKLKNTPAAAYAVAAVEAKFFNLRADKTLEFIKNPLFGLTPAESDLFENYILKYNINYNAFLSPFLYDGDAEEIRKKLIFTLEGIAGDKTYSGFAESLANLIARSEEAFNTYLAEIKKEEMLYESNRLSLDKVKEILAEISELLGEREGSLEEMLDTLKASIAASEISIIPQFIDGVFIGNLRESRYENLRAVFVVSASAGMLPSEQGFRAIISAADSDMLEASGIRLYPTPIDLIREEEFLILDLLTKAENFYIGYSEFTPTGEASPPSYVIKELVELLSKEPSTLNGRFELAGLKSDGELIYGAASPRNAYFQYLMNAKRIPKRDNFRIGLLSQLYASLTEEQRAKADALILERQEEYIPPPDLYFKKDESGAYLTGITQIENYFGCPYKHHLTYGIALKERETGKLKAVDIGIIIHKALEIYFKNTKGKLRELTKEELALIAALAAEEAVKSEAPEGVRFDPQTENILKSIEKECRFAIEKITENILSSRFEPVYIEQPFGYAGGFPAITVKDGSGGVYKLRGKIDRIDIWNGRAAVIDVKTGKASPTYAELYYGVKVQLYVYLRALKAKGLTPAGAFYLPVRDGYSEDGAAYTMEGFFDGGEEVLTALDATAAALAAEGINAKSSHIKVTLKKDKSGKIVPYSSKAKYPLSYEKFSGFIDYAGEVIKKGLEEMRSGYIAKSPLSVGGDTPCSFCEFKVVCLGEGAERERLSDTALINTEEEQ